MVGPERVQLAAAVGSSSVVMPRVLGQDAAQLAFAEDQRPVGELGPGGEHEAFRISLRPRLWGGIFTAWMPRLSGCIKLCGELPSAVADQEPETPRRGRRDLSGDYGSGWSTVRAVRGEADR
jgi:hypothetical protein